MAAPETELDPRYGEPGAGPTSWADARRTLADAELSWLTTLRPDGRPHTTPLITVLDDDAVVFTTGPEEQKGRNLAVDARCSLTTGTNMWAEGLDVVVEGTAERVTGEEHLRTLAAAYLAKYGDPWRFEVDDGAFTSGGHVAHVFRVAPTTAYAFAKAPHSHTRFRFAG
ncbi:pyridoxamine 5'-phosphate oxidase family protein [Iamia majanohamensis]|uniref:Pyridoxamine 5'-phosphate oxidase family protein n=1 Tax=Iamia majanohamensis TaxID=467976 RepID=A0AAE9Y8I7_9ACTN|nr:pyridoxamine 5'-phosphate oxidase family protein [Iamia majanohamensis]WCO68715.1 pyridoxamine 5'-phosphate oxidase family protein [Iamia majanohamensis]